MKYLLKTIQTDNNKYNYKETKYIHIPFQQYENMWVKDNLLDTRIAPFDTIISKVFFSAKFIILHFV